ncbi:PAS domain S-box-containing protein/diguanylate cyclase (GGDEF) domain-containing protein [Desulfonispora thiosulfatigenes DSM 11270]|uniref:PAS domain S-box-containing protein/diguanylate cyclase (GGDEF) domain-containing protein n=1 Tax=Desulfonispora thiosulfatigenes DSM 11270 TaxID=656914 RepID=A0A1W1V9T3_DESTI|nr:diguanylate cyclase [Desulfonispora thiosulfatigenes]SMB89764.1 PAS domain S-box-containing protein/diguanylate cyclase (GGDEF) domain-containing protein [Desulfonispora thiosulfatigenes DSM 11270]
MKGGNVIKFHILTLFIVLSLILGTQVIALFVQYRVNRPYRGIGYWLLGSSLMALGFIFMPMVTVKSLEMFARIANPLLILGHIFLYIGIKQFFNKKVTKWIPISIFVVLNLSYYYYMYINNDISARTFVVTATIAIISFMISYQLFCKKNRLISSSANFTAAVFFVYGCFYTVRTFRVSMLPTIHSYTDQEEILIIGAILSIIISNLWTFGLIIMVNQRLNSDNQLEKEKLQLIFNTNPDAQLITRLNDGFIVEVNDGFSVLSGYSRAEVIGDYIRTISFWHNPADRQLFITELNDKVTCENREFIFQRKDNSQFSGMISARIIMIHSVPHIISAIRDITERKQFEEALIESEEKYRSILNASPDDITITDLEGNILMISSAAKKMFGYKSDFNNFIGMQLLDFIIPEDVERAKSNLQQMYQGGNLKANEYHGVRQDQSIFDIEVNSGFVYSANGLPDKMVFIIRDITERKLAERKIQKLVQQLEIEKNIAQLNSITDSMTGLANRRYFDETLKTEFFRLRRSGSTLSLIMLDIDYFKKFNDSYGHLAGDQCLRMIATTLKTIISRAPDIVARYGGEEFIIILPETDEDGAKALGERIRKAVEELAIPHCASDIAKCVTASLGIVTVYPTELISPEQVLKQVDEALYCAKKRGRNRCLYSSNEKL